MKEISNDELKKEFSKRSNISEKDAKKILNEERGIMDKVNSDVLSGYINDVKLYFQMLKDYFSGKYKQLPLGSLIAIAFALIYIFNPVDLIPDSIPVLGLTDDAGILKLCLKLTRQDVENYKRFKNIS